MHSAPVHSPLTISGGSEFDTNGSSETCGVSYLPNFRPGAIVQYLFFLTTHHIVMFRKAALIFLVVGALSVNDLIVPVVRSPAPEPGCRFPLSFSIVSYHDLALVSFNSPRTQGQDPPPSCSYSRLSPTTGPGGRDQPRTFHRGQPYVESRILSPEPPPPSPSPLPSPTAINLVNLDNAVSN